MDLGFERAGFDVHWSNDLDGTACQTYQTNFNSENVIGPIENLAKSLKRFSEVDCVFGGPPCQGFSVAGKMDLEDPRSKLVYQFMDIISVLRPKSFVMENVPSLATLKCGVEKKHMASHSQIMRAARCWGQMRLENFQIARCSPPFFWSLEN